MGSSVGQVDSYSANTYVKLRQWRVQSDFFPYTQGRASIHTRTQVTFFFCFYSEWTDWCQPLYGIQLFSSEKGGCRYSRETFPFRPHCGITAHPLVKHIPVEPRNSTITLTVNRSNHPNSNGGLTTL